MFDIKKILKHILKNFDLYVASLVLSILVILTFLGVYLEIYFAFSIYLA